MTDRISCCVPFCRRTISKDKLAETHNEWICQKHWAMVPKSLKRRKRVTEQLWERSNDRFLDQVRAQECGFTWPQHGRVMAARDLAVKIWERCKAAAIERAAGI
ncbi:hypothetical protein G6L12_08330 [Agrobacterium rhizogenes]|nr:hypothetical protein [Rhizobium rhizogenes]NTF74480.1 hypothetical protein [Rhizobium rhizogenes]